jgi:hypothetical protein
MREETNMRHTRHSIILGTVFFATVALWPAGAQASAIPNSGAQATIAADHSPYSEGYAKGSSDGYARGESRALNYCTRDYSLSNPEVGEGAYKVGYGEGFELGYGRGYDDGFAKHCKPA